MEIFDASPLLIEWKNDRSSWSEARIDKIGLVGSCSYSARDRLLVIRATEENGMNFKERWDTEREKCGSWKFSRVNSGGIFVGGKSAVTIAFYRRFPGVSGTKHDMKRSYIAVGAAVLYAFRKFCNGWTTPRSFLTNDTAHSLCECLSRYNVSSSLQV